MNHDDPMQEYIEAIAEAEREVTSLFMAVSKKLSTDEAKRIFTKILKQRRGRKSTSKSQNLNGFLLALRRLGVTSQTALADWAYKNNEQLGRRT